MTNPPRYTCEFLDSVLLTDLYQLTMMQAYLDREMNDEAVFEFFVRPLPSQRNFLVAAGLEQTLDYLESLRFSDSDLDALAEIGLFSDAFLAHLANLRFTGRVDALREGTLVFPNEPMIRVVAPLPEAQLVESRVINLLQYQTLIASKAARCVIAAPGKLLVDFGMRRAHGAEAAILAARASYIAGFAGTSNVLAKQLFDIPVFGTMAHSFIEAHDGELEAFRHFAASHQGPVVLLIDTYDTEVGAERVVALSRELPEGAIHSIRLDSGDLDALARRVREILDAGGCSGLHIFASGGIDESRLQSLVGAGAPIDGFGIGTNLDVSADYPALDCAYKLQEYAGKPRRKRSTGKATWPGSKQIFREYDTNGCLSGDTLTLLGAECPGEPLLETVMANGRRIEASPSLASVRERTRQELERLPHALRSLGPAAPYPVEIAEPLRQLADAFDREYS
jgi:nicotinate phosphoribosyltransferase